MLYRKAYRWRKWLASGYYVTWLTGQSNIDLNPNSKNYKTRSLLLPIKIKQLNYLCVFLVLLMIKCLVISGIGQHKKGDQSVLRYDYSYYVRRFNTNLVITRLCCDCASTGNAGAYDCGVLVSYKQPWLLSLLAKPTSGQENNVIYFDEAYGQVWINNFSLR